MSIALAAVPTLEKAGADLDSCHASRRDPGSVANRQRSQSACYFKPGIPNVGNWQAAITGGVGAVVGEADVTGTGACGLWQRCA
jgi:hypothetical protein